MQTPVTGTTMPAQEPPFSAQEISPAALVLPPAAPKAAEVDAAVIESLQADASQSARYGFLAARGTNADMYAQAQQLAQATGMPIETVLNRPDDAKQQAEMGTIDFDALAKTAPATAAFLADVEKAKLAHDDVQNMGYTEMLLNSAKRGWLARQAGQETLALHALGERLTAIEQIDRRIAAGESPKKVLGDGYHGFTPIPSVAPESEMAEWNRQKQVYYDELRSRSGAIAHLLARRNAIPLPQVMGAANEKTKGGFLHAFSKDWLKFIAAVGPESLMQSLPGMVLGGVSGPFAPAVMGGNSFLTDYASSLQENLQEAGVDTANPAALEAYIRSNPQALRELSNKASRHAAVVGAVDGISGGVAGKFLLPKKEAAKGVAKFLARELANVAVQTPVQGALGGIGEAGGQIYAGEAGDVGAMLRKAGEGHGAAALGDLDAGLHWGKIMSEMTGEAFGTPGEVASIGLNSARARYAQISHARQSAQAEQALQGAQTVAELNQASAQSKLRQRDPQAYENLVADAAAGGDLQNVFIDAHTLMQSGVAEQVAAVSPAVAAQLQEAAQTGGQIAIPMEEYASKIAPTEYAQQLADHLRTDPEGMTPAEAKSWQGSEAQAQFEQDTARAQAEHTAAQAQEQDTATVAQTVQQQLDTAGRFTPDVNQKYATLVGEFFSTAAAKIGTTAQELYARFPLRVAADLGFGKNVYTQQDLTPTEVASAAWRESLAKVGKAGIEYAAQLQTPAALRAMGFKHAKMAVPTRVLQEIANRHPEVPGSVIEQLPELMHDPLYVYRHKDGGMRVILDATTAKGEPIAVGVDDGRLRTITPIHNHENLTGMQRVERAVADVYRTHGEKLFAKNVETLRLIRAEGLSTEGYRHNRVGPLTHGRASITGTPRLVKQFGEDYYQQARGAFNPDTLQISLLQDADLSTFLHETGHFFLEMTAHLAAQADAPASFAQDMALFFEWAGFTGEGLDAWQNLSLEEKRPYHEKFAQGFEAYLIEGKAPSPALQGLFGTFRAWLLKVYERITALDVRLTDEVRGVFDRMLASGEEIALAEHGRSMLPLFESAEQMGGAPEQFAAYQALGQSATQDAVDNLQARSIRDMQWLQTRRASVLKQLQREAKAQRDGVRAEVAEQVRNEPAYVAWEYLTGKPDGDAPAGRLHLAALQDMGLPAEAVNVLQARKMTAAEGMHPDVVAESVKGPDGNPLFDSGDALVRAVAAAPDMQAAINDQTDARMLQEYGDLSSQEAVEKAADRAIHNEARARFVATEANALADAVGQRRVLAAAAREYALKAIDRLKVRHLRPGQYVRAEVRAARAADTAFRKGDIATAAAEKRNQLLQVQLARAAHEAQAYVDSSLRFLKKFDSDAVRRKIGADYADQIDTLLERFDLRSGQSLRAIDKRANLAQWIAQQQERGIDPQIPPELANEALRISYKDLTVEELRGLVDTVKQIDHLGRLKNRLLTDKKQRDYETVRNGMAQTLVENARQSGKNTGTPATWLGKRRDGLKGFGAAHIKAATWARILDGGKDGGAWWSALIRPANERAAWETQQRAASTQALMAIWKPVLKNVPYMDKVGKGKLIPGLGISLNWEQRIGFALNYGNESNAQRLRDGGLAGRGALTDAQVQAVLRTLTAAEWQAVQASWDHLESFKEQIAAKERRIFGKEPEWIEARPFVVQTADGQTVALRGGYYPVKYDPHASQEAHQHANAEDAKNTMKAAYSVATTQRSFTKQRANEVHGRPLLLSMQGLYSGVNDVIHDLAFHEWAIDANRLMGSRTLDALVREHYGPHAKMELEKWVNDVVAGSKRLDSVQERTAGFFRRNVSVAALGFNAMSALMQPLGITQSFARVGTRWVAKGLGQYLAAPIEATAQVKAKSAFMENRTRTLFRDLNEIANKVAGQTSAREWMSRNAYSLTAQFQQFIDIPTWLGAYEKGIAQGFDEDTAVALADQAVKDSQGGGEEVDQSGIARGGPLLKLFTCFYEFMNTQANVLYLSAKTKSKGAAFWDFMIVAVVTPVLVQALKDAITPGDSGDWEDPEKIAKKVGQEVATNFIGMFAFAREFTAAAKSLTGDKSLAYSGPSGVRMVGNAQKLAQQTAQGEFDEAFTRSLIDFTGDVSGLPAVQPNRTIKGVRAVADGKTEGVYETLAAPVFGFQKQR